MHHVSPDRIGLVGDVHGNFATARNAVKVLADAGITEIHFLGDFGFIWSGGSKGYRALTMLHETLEDAGAVGFVTGGNHENYDQLLAIEADSDGLRWITDRIALLPRGWRATTASGRVIASLGGANSIDRYSRTPGLSWWQQEQIDESDLAALGTDRADILLGHDSPMVSSLAGRLQLNEKLWTRAGLAYSELGQKMFQRGFLAVKPALTLGGHYHLSNDETGMFQSPDGVWFECRCVVLDADGEADSVAILDTETLALTFLNDELRAAHVRGGWVATD
jgi:hypothetical protein